MTNTLVTVPRPIDRAQQIEGLRNSLGDKLGEIKRRAASAKRALTPSTYYRNPWFTVGLGVALGVVAATVRSSDRRAESVINVNGNREGLLHSMVRAGLSAAVSSLVARALAPTRDA